MPTNPDAYPELILAAAQDQIRALERQHTRCRTTRVGSLSRRVSQRWRDLTRWRSARRYDTGD